MDHRNTGETIYDFFFNFFYCTCCLFLCPFFCAAFHSTDSGGSRRSSQDSYQGLSDSGSAEEVEECELRGREGTLGWGGGLNNQIYIYFGIIISFIPRFYNSSLIRLIHFLVIIHNLFISLSAHQACHISPKTLNMNV